MKGEEMAYTPMTAEQYVVAELQDAKDRIRILKEDNAFLTDQLNEANDLLNQLCKRMSIHRSSTDKYNFISLDLCPADDYEPELFEKLKWRIESIGAD